MTPPPRSRCPVTPAGLRVLGLGRRHGPEPGRRALRLHLVHRAEPDRPAPVLHQGAGRQRGTPLTGVPDELCPRGQAAPRGGPTPRRIHPSGHQPTKLSVIKPPPGCRSRPCTGCGDGTGTRAYATYDWAMTEATTAAPTGGTGCRDISTAGPPEPLPRNEFFPTWCGSSVVGLTTW